MSHSHSYLPTIDVLRGFAICGITFVNILVLGAYIFLPADLKSYYSSDPLDQWALFLSDVLCRYKFYTLFSFLFGLGFSMLLVKASKNPPRHFMRTYLTRLGFLFFLGWVHTFIFSGDILRMYAVIGLLLLFFKDLSNRNLLIAIFTAFFIPIIFSIFESTGYYFNPAIYFPPPENMVIHFQQGPWIHFALNNFENTLYYLADNLTSRRFFKILGLFLLGLYVGRLEIFHHLDRYLPMIKRILPYAWLFSLTTNVIFAEFTTVLDPFIRELLYAMSVYPLTFTYVITIIYLYDPLRSGQIAKSLASVGRMSLSCYIGESILSCVFMLWFGLAWAGKLYVVEYYAIAALIILILFVASRTWLKYFKLGPLEYLMRYCSRLVNPPEDGRSNLKNKSPNS